MKLAKIIIWDAKLLKFSESEGHLQLRWALDPNPLGPGDPQLVHSGLKWVPNGANKGQGGPGYGPEEPKMSQKSPNITLLVNKNGQGGHQKGGQKRPKGNNACLLNR